MNAVRILCLIPCILVGAAGASAQGSTGPDVIVGDLLSMIKWGTVGEITGYSVGTESCNIGDETLSWVDVTNQHPVIAQNLYRLENGRIEQIGMSWLKHGFGALALDLCGTCEDPGTFDRLGVGCSDPYTAGLNGDQAGFFGIGGLGPRSEVDPSTGSFPFPYGSQGQNGNDIYKRLQVRTDDLDPSLHPGARYFIEGHYVTPDDALAGNQNNNVSYREVVVGTFTGGGFNLATTGSTEREKPAVLAWADDDPTVHVSIVDVPGDGRLYLLSQATDLGGGRWGYEYALYNMNSHRGARSLRIPVPAGLVAENPGFHDVDHHSGEPFDGTDWNLTVSRGGGAVFFSTETHAQNVNANAVRWGTTYNFRFEAEREPILTHVTVGLFRPGSPGNRQPIAFAPRNVELDEVTAGRVNTGAGAPADVLFLNGSSGVGETRRVVIGLDEAVALDGALPPSMAGSACSVVWAWLGEPTTSSIVGLRFGLGFSAFPTPLTPDVSPQPARIANSFPTQFDGLLGAEQWPQSPTGKLPTRLLDVPGGVGFPVVLHFQGLVEDSAAPNGLAAITNGITLVVE